MYTPIWKSQLWRKLVAASCGATAALMVACGGGVLVAEGVGVGTGGTGIVNGTISGLGSIIVEGQRYDDSQATLVRLPDLLNAQTLALSDLQVGQYAQLELDAAGTMVRATIQSQLVGAVGTVSATNGRFTVWGQTVSINTQPDAGPVTVFSGYTGLAGMSPQDRVQVYGTLQTDSTDATRDVIRATRVERLIGSTTLPARITGTARAAANGHWTLSGFALDASSAVVVPANQKVSDGNVVTAIIPWPSTTGSTPTPFKASALQILGLADTSAASARVSGVVTATSDGRILVQGVPIDVSSPAFAAQRDSVRAGAYVTLVGSVDHAAGALVANAAETVPAGGRPMELRGSVTSLLNPNAFSVRGMWIDASAAQWLGGSAASLTNGRYVEVSGSVLGNTLKASKVVLQGTLPDTAVLDVTGVVQSVDSAGRRMSVITADGQKMDWVVDPATVLPSVGSTVRAEGYWKSGSLQANSVSNQQAMDNALILLEGIVEAVAASEFTLNGVVVHFDPAVYPALQLKGGERVQVWVKLAGGKYQLVEAKNQPPRH